MNFFYELYKKSSLQINTPPFRNQPPNITYTKPQYVEKGCLI